MRCSLFVYVPPCFLNSTLLTYTFSLSYSIYLFLLPPFCLTPQTKKWCITLQLVYGDPQSRPAFLLEFARQHSAISFFSEHNVSYLWLCLSPLCLDKLVLPLFVIFGPFVKHVWPPLHWNSYDELRLLWSL